jgi:Uma2 family endonuclease
MNTPATLIPLKPAVAPPLDRPGWIPAGMHHNWDPNPYAYQTEEELMPAGGLHGQLLGYLMELLRVTLKQRGLMLLLDVFILYRDENNIKQRISPDLLLMPLRDPPPSAYDLDDEPPPLCVIEVTSPKSHRRDLEEKAPFYAGLGVSTYLVIDAITPRGKPRAQIGLSAWRRSRPMAPDAAGRLALPEMGLRIEARGRHLAFVDVVSGKLLFDMEDLLGALEQERRARRWEQQARVIAEARAQEEAAARATAESQAQEEAAARAVAEARAQEEAAARATAESQAQEEAAARAVAEARAQEEAAARAVAEAELAQLRAELARLRGE